MNRNISNGFIKLDHQIMDSAAWRSTSSGALILLLEIWKRHNGNNNGAIAFSQREAERILRASSKTVIKWFKELQENGFLVPTRKGSFDWKSGARARRATTWRLTMVSFNGAEPTNEYLKGHSASPNDGGNLGAITCA